MSVDICLIVAHRAYCLMLCFPMAPTVPTSLLLGQLEEVGNYGKRLTPTVGSS